MSDKFLILKERSTQCLEGSRVEARLAQLRSKPLRFVMATLPLVTEKVSYHLGELQETH